jgi:hypothetical protein
MADTGLYLSGSTSENINWAMVYNYAKFHACTPKPTIGQIAAHSRLAIVGKTALQHVSTLNI